VKLCARAIKSFNTVNSSKNWRVLSDNSGPRFRISSGTGKSILSGGDGKTKCGKFLDDVPGRPRTGTLRDVDCRLCQTGFQSFIEFEHTQQHWRQLSEENAQARAEQHRLWWDQYNAYLLTETWNAKRLAVLERANHVCEGCGQAKATQAHRQTRFDERRG
jgi:hypothetical protein